MSSELAQRRGGRTVRRNLLILYDEGSTHVGTVKEHLLAFQRYSRHAIFYMPATVTAWDTRPSSSKLDFSAFDAVVLHYSVRLSTSHHLLANVATAVRDFGGPKLLFIQDEYDATETARLWIETLKISSVYTNVPEAAIAAVYPPSRFPGVRFVSTLTGFVPEDDAIESYSQPLEKRPNWIGYRGRRLPHHYGDLGFEKYQIGIAVKDLAIKAGLPVDIEVDDRCRIHGSDWYRFLGSCRAMLGTESGSNIFDVDGRLADLSIRHAGMPYTEFRERFLHGLEPSSLRMNQISPKIFEAIRLRTALILFEGRYSDVVTPGIHYIPLKKDFSNIDDVFSKLADTAALQTLVDRAYADVIATGQHTYRVFVEGVDDHLESQFGPSVRARFVSAPILAVGRSDEIGSESILGSLPPDVSTGIFDASVTRDHFADALGRKARDEAQRRAARTLRRIARRLWRFVPSAVRGSVAQWIARQRKT